LAKINLLTLNFFMNAFLPQNFIKAFTCFLFILISAFGYAQTITDTFTTSGTFVVPNGITTVSVQAWGAGGGSGGHGTSGVTNGGNGGATVFSTISAGGGMGSAGTSNNTPSPGGAGGVATGGSTNTSGTSGSTGDLLASSGTLTAGGNGGFSFGGVSVNGSTAANTNPPTSFPGTQGGIRGGGAGGSSRGASNSGSNPNNKRSTGGGGGGAYVSGPLSGLIPGNSIAAAVGLGGTAGAGSEAGGGAGGGGELRVSWDCDNALTSGAGSDNQSVCLNTPIAPITYNVKGSRNNNTPSITGLPAGVSATYNAVTGVLTISGTPTVGGTFTYILTQTGECAYSTTGVIAIPVTTWNGSAWNNGDPSAEKSLIFTGTYSSDASIVGCSILVTNNASVTILAGADVTLSGALTVETGSSFTLSSNANLFQPEGITNTSAISVKRETSNEVKRLDYNLWSSPVAGQNLLAFSPLTVATRFYVYNSGTNQYNAVTPSTTPFTTAKGYLIRMPNNFSDTTPGIWEGTFTGVPNNGPISISVGIGTYNAIGNPYPSPISVSAYVAVNPLPVTILDDVPEVEGIYFWRKINNSDNTSYATYTPGMGGVANTGGGSDIEPNGIIQVGQGFIVKSTATSINFTNGMRVSDHDNQFLRTSSSSLPSETSSQRSRIWLKMTSSNGFGSQLLVGYLPGATQGIDPGIDGKYINDSQNAFTSMINGKEYVIQGRGLPFLATDVVPLGFKTTQAGLYTVSINKLDGLFDDDAQPIYIKDNVTGTEHNLKVSPYEFTSAAGVFNTRFELMYQTTLSVVSPISEKNVLVYKQNQELAIKVIDAAITNITVYDLSGRIIASQKDFNTNEATMSLGSIATQVLLVKVTTTSGEVTQKILW